MCIFQFPIDPKTRHQWLEKCYPKDKFNKSTRRILLLLLKEFEGNRSLPARLGESD